MGNFFTPWTTATVYTPTPMNAPLASLDRAISYLKNLIVHCDGAVSFHQTSGRLAWSGTLRFIFIGSDGKTYTNYAVGPSSVNLDGNKFAYVDLVETNDTAVTVQAAAVSGGAASNLLPYNRVVLGYQNAVSSEFWPVALQKFTEAVDS